MKRTTLVLAASLGLLAAASFRPGVAHASATAGVAGLPSTWTTSTNLPDGRIGLAAATLNSKIYAAGGQDEYGVLFGDVWAFSPVTKQWTVRASLPAPRSGFYLAVTGGYLYTIGGGTTEVDRYDPVANTWTAVAPMPATVGLPAAAVGADGRIYVLHVGTNSDQVAVYTPATNSWTLGPPLAGGAGGPGDVAAPGHDGLIYSFDQNTGVTTYSPSTNTWQQQAGPPIWLDVTRFDWADARVDARGRFLLVGAWTWDCCSDVGPDDSVGVFEVYDPASRAWVVVDTAPAYAAEPATVMFGSTLYSMGGIAESAGYEYPTSEVDVLPLSDVTPPKVVAPMQVAISPKDGVSLSTIPVYLTGGNVTDPSGTGVHVQRSIDGGPFTDYFWLFLSNFGVTPGHSYTFREQWTDGAGNLSAWAVTPTFRANELQENAGQLVYAGQWTRQANKSALGGYVKSSSVPGASVTFHFTGHSVRFIGTTQGKASIYVDGVLKGALGVAASTYTWPTSGVHTIKIVIVSGGSVSKATTVDAFDYLS